jgi:hypothetical protein
VSAKDDLIATGELIDAVEYLIPGILGHETDERVQTDNRLFIEMVEDGRCEDIDVVTLTPYWMNVLS